MELVPLLSFLSLWVGCTSAQEIRPGPGVVNVPEDDDALLPCALGSGQSIDEFDWRKDNGNEAKEEVFMYNRGSYYGDGKTKGQSQEFTNRVEFFERERKSGNASIIIKNTRLEDNGTYTCGLGLLRGNRQEVHIRLNVGGVLKIRNVTGAAPEPYIKTIRDKITWSLLECKVKGTPIPQVEWRNSAGKVLAELSPESEGGHSHGKLLVNVTRSDNYTCVATQWAIFHRINNTMEVSIPGVIVDVVAVTEGNDAILPCALDYKHIESMVFSWRKDDKEVFFYNRGQEEKDEQFTGRLTLFQNELKSGNASIKIHNTQTTDSGRYTCYLEDVQKSNVILQVVGKMSSFENSPGLVITVILLAIILLVIVIVVVVFCAKGLLQWKASVYGQASAKEC